MEKDIDTPKRYFKMQDKVVEYRLKLIDRIQMMYGIVALGW